MNRKTKRMIASGLSGGIILSNLPSNTFANPNDNLSQNMQIIETGKNFKTKNTTNSKIQNTWIDAFSSMPTGGRTSFSSAVIGNEIYVISGVDNNGNYSSKVHSYNPILDVWDEKAELPIGLKGSSAIAVGSKIYCMGGSTKDGAFSNEVFVYDSSTNKWDSSKANMLIPRENLSLVSIGSKIFALGGRNHAGVLKTVEVYDTNTDIWQYKNDMVVAREKFTAQAVGEKIYIIGGFNDYDSILNNMEEYDTVKNTSVYKKNIPDGKMGLTSAIIGRKIYCLGGTGFNNKTYVYDTETNYWEEKRQIPTPRTNLGSGLINGVIYTIGGEGGSNLVEGYVASINNAPKIDVDDKTIFVGDPYHPLDGVTAYDEEDKDITGYVNVLLDTVDNSTPGVYNVIYEVEDSDGVITTKEIKVSVKVKLTPIIDVCNKSIFVGDSFDPMKDVFALDRYGKDLTPYLVYSGNVDVTKPGKYNITYSVIDEYGVRADEDITVTVKGKLENFDITINAKDKTIIAGSNVNLLDGVTAKNSNGIDLTSGIEVETNLDTSKEGRYIATYIASDEESTAFKTINIDVIKRSSLNNAFNEEAQSRIIAEDKKILVGDKFDSLKDVVAKDVTGNDLTEYLLVTNNDVNVNKTGSYSVTYVVLDSNGERVTKVRNIDVVTADNPENIGDQAFIYLSILGATIAGLYIINRKKDNNKDLNSYDTENNNEDK